MTKKECVKASEIISQYMFTKNIYTPSINEAVNAIELIDDNNNEPCIKIPTPNGEMTANLGDYIIRDTQGNLYPCKADIFKQTYEEIKECSVKLPSVD